MNTPAISIVIPSYNSSVFLGQTLASIFRQEFSDYEIIVVDDCSTDDTDRLIGSVADPRLRYLRLNSRHGGPSRPRNVGIKAARADAIAFFDSDDLMSPGRLELELSLLSGYPNLGLVLTNAEKFSNETGEVLCTFHDGYERFNRLTKDKTALPDCFVIPSADAYGCLLYENYVLSGGTVPRFVFDDVGLFDERLTNADDWDMWLRIARKYDIGFVNRIGFRYRVRGGSVSTRGGTLALNRNRVVQKQIDSGLPTGLLDQAHHLLSVNYYAAGYQHQVAEEFGKARDYYFRSLREERNLAALRGLGISLLPPRLFRLLRRALRGW